MHSGQHIDGILHGGGRIPIILGGRVVLLRSVEDSQVQNVATAAWIGDAHSTMGIRGRVYEAELFVIVIKNRPCIWVRPDLRHRDEGSVYDRTDALPRNLVTNYIPQQGSL